MIVCKRLDFRVRLEDGQDKHDAGPSNFCATSRRYQARIVSGLATRAISRAFRPNRFAMSARVHRFASDKRS